MFTRVFLLFFSITSILLAEPSLAQVKQAVTQNPALLNTPQAKAMMKAKGVTLSEVKQKLAQSNATSTKMNSEVVVKNNINTKISENNSSSKGITDNKSFKKQSERATRVNPFAYKSNEIIRAELNAKQQREHGANLNRYSMSFYANENRLDSSSLPTPDDYIMSVGDRIGIHVYGDRDQRYSVKIKNDGTIDLAFIGPLKIGGMEFAQAKKHLIHELKNHFKMSNFNVNIDKYSTIQVTLIGDVKYPGLYNLSSFATVKDLLVVAKGVRKSASVRDIIVKRNSKVIAKLDFYDLLFKGNSVTTVLLKHGDVVIINKAKKIVSIDGYVNNAAKFELKGKESLKDLINYAGGLKPDASKSEIKIKRFDDNAKLKTFKVSYKESRKFQMKDGDSVYIYPLDFSAKNSINVYGNVIRPGTYSLNSKKTLNEFFKQALKGGVKKFFLPDTYFEYGVIKRYNNNLQYTTQSFNLTNVINGTELVKLHPNDKVYIFGFNDIYSNSYVMTKGSNLIRPGKLQYFTGMTIQDAINAAGIDGVLDDKVKVTTYATEDYMPKTSFYSLKTAGNTVLNPHDEVEVYDYYSTHTLEPVTIKGEVINPTTVYFEKGMSLADLVNDATGLTKRAYNKDIEIVRYYVDENQTRQRKILKIDTTNKSFQDIRLQPYDVVRIFKIPNWNDTKEITLRGEVKFPGTYTIENGEKLSSVIERAGGFTKEAFIEGAVFTRESIKKQQIEQYNSSLAKIKKQLAIYNAMPANAKQAAVSSQTSTTLNEVMKEAEKYQPIGRVSIVLEKDLEKFKDSEFDLVLKDKDTLTIPNHIDTVTVFGEVFNPTSFVYNDNLDADDYLAMASGLSRSADSSSIYVIHANGASEPLENGWFSAEVEIKKGDTIVVPLYIKETNAIDVWDAVARVLSSFALTAASAKTIGVI